MYVPKIKDIAKKLDTLSESLIIEWKKQESKDPSFVISPQLLTEIKNYLLFAAGIDQSKSVFEEEDSAKIIDLGTKLLHEGYPSIDEQGLFPTSNAIALILLDLGHNSQSKYTAHLEEYLSMVNQLESSIMLRFIEDILDQDEEIIYAEHGIVDMKFLLLKYKRNGIVLTNRRIIFVGCDTSLRNPQSTISPMYVSFGPYVRIDITPSGKIPEFHMRFHYPNTQHESYFSSVDYIDLDKLV
ncbi:MAG: hypothetical protein ACW98Y_19145, partial [Candidatus Thorarchaeota archaeon]